MAGLGRKVFTRERATVYDVQGYLMDQAVMVFPSASAREAALPTADVTPGMVSYLEDVKRYEACDTPGAWSPLSRAPLRSRDYTTGGINSTTGYAALAAESVTITPRDAADGRRIRVLVRGNFGSGTASPFVRATLDGALLDPNEGAAQLVGRTTWYFQSNPLAAGTYSVVVDYRSATSGTAASAGNVSVDYEVI